MSKVNSEQLGGLAIFTLCMNEITLRVSVVLANKSGSNTFLIFVYVIVISHLNKFKC